MSEPTTAAPRSGPGYGAGRQALLEATIHIVAARGLRHLTYRAVAAEARVAHGLVTHHFGTREALLEAAFEFSLANSMALISTRPGSGDLDALFGGVVDMARTRPDDPAFQYELILESRRRPELRPYVKRSYAAYYRALRVELEAAGLDPDDTMLRLVFGAMDGLIFQQVCLGNPRRAAAAIERLRDLLRPLAKSTAAVAATRSR